MDIPVRRSSRPAPYRLRFDYLKQYLFARVECDTISAAIATAYFSEIVAETVQMKYNLVLIRREIPKTLVVAKFQNVFSNAQSFGIGNAKFAFCGPSLKPSDNVRIAAALNGIDAPAVFAARDRWEAIRWLTD